MLRNALGIVYCLASGNHQSTREGAPTKHVQPGFAAANAIAAALMASGGLDGVKQPLTGEDGLAQGCLKRALEERCPPFPGYHLYYCPHRGRLKSLAFGRSKL